ncbi:MAG TPA: hypothetical protein VGR57_01030 [Ktedonobacterales bacterium]|nr:hypothetical protein [Ktedonobacterales bacterium]
MGVIVEAGVVRVAASKCRRTAAMGREWPAFMPSPRAPTVLGQDRIRDRISQRV